MSDRTIGKLDDVILSLFEQNKLKVTLDGRIWALRHGRMQELSQRDRSNGYLAVDVWDGTQAHSVYVQRVMYLALHGRIPADYEVDHLDRDRTNNSATNLRAVSRSVNDLNRDQGGENNPGSKLDWQQVREIRRLYGTGPSQRDLARIFNVSPATIRMVTKRQSWWPDPEYNQTSITYKAVLDDAPSIDSPTDNYTDSPAVLPGEGSIAVLDAPPRSPEELSAVWEQEQAKLLWEGTKLDQQPERYEDAKTAYAATYGNASRAARLVGLHPDTLRQYASRDNWPNVPTPSKHPKTTAQKASRSHVEHLASLFEARMYGMIDSLVVEEKERVDIAEKGLLSSYVAPLSQRSTAFKIIFDSWMRLKTILEPEMFGFDEGKNNPHAARLQRQKELMGGAEGIERQLAAFFAGINVTADLGDRGKQPAFVDAEIVAGPERGLPEASAQAGLGKSD